MPLQIKTCPYVLARFADNEERARIAHESDPSPENAAALKQATAVHKDYRRLHVKASLLW